MFRSIKTKVLVSQIALIVLVTVFMGVTSYFTMKSHLMSAQEEKLRVMAESKARDVEKQFSGHRQLFEAITSSDALESYRGMSGAAAAREHFMKFAGAFPDLSYSGFDGVEEFRLAGGRPSGELRDISDSVIFQDATWTPGKVFVSGVRPGRGGKPSVGFAVARESFFGEPVGVVMAEAPISEITAPLKDSAVGKTGLVAMADADGSLLSHPDGDRLLTKLDGADADALLTEAREGNSGFGRATLMGADSLVAFAPVEGTGWTVIAALPYKEFIAGPNRLRNTIAAASAAILALVGLMALLAVRGTTRALTKLTEAARAIAGGDFRQRVHISTGDEVGALAESFNRMTEELEKTNRSLHNLSAHILSVREEERKAVAREVHDELGQVLSTLKIDLSWLRKRLPEGQPELAEKARAMLELVDSTIDTVQNITSELRPLVLDDLGLAAAIESEAGRFQARTGIRCEADVEDMALDPAVSAAVFRVLQEAMLNVARHSEASRASITLAARDGALELTVKDNGKGITDAEREAPTAFGLMGMRERIMAMDGKVEISGKKNMGTLVAVSVPLRRDGGAR